MTDLEAKKWCSTAGACFLLIKLHVYVIQVDNWICLYTDVFVDIKHRYHYVYLNEGVKKILQICSNIVCARTSYDISYIISRWGYYKNCKIFKLCILYAPYFCDTRSSFYIF